MSLNIPFYGASKSVRTRLNHFSGGIDSFGTVRAQVFDAEKSKSETVEADTGTFDVANVDTLNVTNAISVPKIVVNGGNDEIIVATTANETTGDRGVLVGSGTSASSDTISIGQNNTISANSTYSIVIGSGNTVDNDHNIVIGSGTVNGREYNILVGFGTSVATGDNSVVMGRSAISVGDRTVVLGYSSSVDNDDSVAIGNNAGVVGVSRGIAVGLNASVSGGSGVSVGPNSTVVGTNSVSVGTGATSTGANCVSVGGLSNCGAVTGAVAVGTNALASGASSVCMGYNCSVTGTGISIGGSSIAVNGVSLGTNANSTGTGVALGGSANASFAGAVALGAGVSSRIVDEVATAGMRVIRFTTTTVGAGSVSTTFFTLNANGEAVAIDGAVIAHNDSATLGAEVVSIKFENYIGRRSIGAAAINDGTDSTNDPFGKGYTCTIGASGTNLQVTVTNPGADTVTWTVVMRVYCAPLV